MASDSSDSIRIPDSQEPGDAAETEDEGSSGDGTGSVEGGGSDSVAFRSDDRDKLGWEFLLDFRQVVHELEQDEAVCHLEWATYDPVPDFTLETLEHGLGLTVPEFITEFYRLTDGLYLSWDRKTEEGIVPGGGFELFDFATVFDSWLETLWPTDPPAGCDADFLWSLRGVAEAPGDDTGDMIVMCIEEEYPTFDLFIHNPSDRRSHLMQLDFHGYLHALLETRGVFGWPYLFSESDLEDDPELASIRQRAEQRIDAWFPETSLASL